MPQALGLATATGPWPAIVAGLVAALALAQPAGSFAQQPFTHSFGSGARAPAAIAGRGLAQAPVRASVAEGGRAVSDTVAVDTLSTTPDAEPPSPPPPSGGDTGTWIANRPAASGDDDDILPFAHNEVPRSFPSLGIAIGVGAYLSGFSSIERAFDTMEDTYRAGGFPVPQAGNVDMGPMVVSTITLRLNRRLDVAAQVGGINGLSDELRLIGGLVSARNPLTPAGKVSVFAGLGGGAYRFSSKRNYGVRITPNDSNGGYYQLDAITLEGGGNYWTAAGGLTIRAWPGAALEARVQYVGTGDVSTAATQAGTVRVNMSGAMIAVSITNVF